jgi:hypothetical protein
MHRRFPSLPPVIGQSAAGFAANVIPILVDDDSYQQPLPDSFHSVFP